MQRLFVIILSLFLTTKLYGQKSEIENLINQASKKVVPTNFEYYNLIDSSFISNFGEHSLEPRKLKELLKEHPDFPLEKFIKTQKDRYILNWADFNLKNAKIYPYATIPKFESQIRIVQLRPFNTPKPLLDSLKKSKKYNEIIVPVKRYWSEKRINKETEKAWEDYSNSVKTENKVFFQFSTPIFVDNYAIISLNTSGGGSQCIFKKINDKWERIFIVTGWTP